MIEIYDVKYILGTSPRIGNDMKYIDKAVEATLILNQHLLDFIVFILFDVKCIYLCVFAYNILIFFFFPRKHKLCGFITESKIQI